MGASPARSGLAGRAVWSAQFFIRPPEAAHSGFMLRLFNRGHIEEARFIAMLLTIGHACLSTGSPRKMQFRIHFGVESWQRIWVSVTHIIIMPQLWIVLVLQRKIAK